MQTLALILLAAGVLGAPALRLLPQALRNRQLPELWAGLFFLGLSIGLPLRIYGAGIQAADPVLAERVNAIGHVFFAAGVIAMTIFTWRVFHPGGRVARAVAISIVLLVIGSTAYALAMGLGSAERSASILFVNACRILPIGWACLESLLYWRLMKRRLKLRLADPVVTNRFLLWAVWTGAAAALPTLALVMRALAFVLGIGDPGAADPEPYRETALLLARILFLIVAPIAALALSLSFFPPRRYLQRVRERATTALGT